MEYFSYTAIDKDGNEKKGHLDALSMHDALNRIKQMELFPAEVIPVSASQAKENIITVLWRKTTAASPGKHRIKTQDLVIFTRQLFVLLDAGLPLVRGLHTLQKQTRVATLNALIGDIADSIESGRTFSDALAHYPCCFSKVYVNIIKAGETGGALDQVLKSLADYLEKNLKLTQRIHAALIYPALVLTISLGILSFIIAFVIPRFMELFQDTGVALPLLTMMLMSLSKFLLVHWYLFIGGVAALAMGYRVLLRNYSFRFWRDSMVLRMPVCGILIQKVTATRFARTLSTLLSGGVPILRALELSKEVTENEVVAKTITAVYDSVREGGFISRILEQNEVFPQLMVSMIAVGEESGSLDKMLAKVADTFEEEVEITANTLTSLLEPILVIGVGGIVGIIVLAMFLPLISLIQSLTK